MSIKGVNIKRGKVGAGINALADAISGLLVNGPAVVADLNNGVLGIAVGTAVALTSTSDAIAYGITAEYDSTNKVRVFRHIDEFYQKRGEGVTLWLMLYTGVPTDALGVDYARKLIAQANGEIRQLAIAYNPATNYAATYVDGLEEDIRDAIPAAQELYDWAFETYRPCQMILEGRGFNAVNDTAALNLRGITVSGNIMEYYKVTLCIAQDWTYAETQDTIGKKMADVGTLLGSIALQPVHKNVGEVETMNLTNTAKGRWLVAGLSNHTKVVDFEPYLPGLDTKGYVFAMSYTGYAGYYWNDDHTCTPVIVDEDDNMNENSISLGRVHDKACRVLRTSLLPKVKSTQPVDSTTGLLPPTIVTYFEEIGNTAFDTKMKGEVSYAKTKVDGSSNLLVAPKELKCSFVVIPQGQVGVITGTINLKTSA